jgi:cell division protein FtsQ
MDEIKNFQDDFQDENLKIDNIRQRPPRKKKRKKKNYLLRLFLLICFSILLYLFLSSSIFDIQEITVENSSYFTKEQIINIAGAKTGGNIFASRTSKMKEKLLLDPYIKNAKVSRRLPDKINIDVQERVEAAYLTYRSDYIIIDNEGIVLRQAAIEPKLTSIEGVTIIKIEPGTPIQVEENAMMTSTIALLKKMNEQEMYFKKIKVSSVVVKAYIYDSLICQASPEVLANNMTQLNDVIYDLYKKGIERGQITMGDDGYFSFSPIPE